MAQIVLADRVKETTTTTGTGTLNLDGASAGFQGFVAGVATASRVYYSIVGQDGGGSAGEWENGEGVVTDATPDTLSRLVVHSSSNAGALVNFSAGTHDVWVTFPAARASKTPWGFASYDPSTASEQDIDITGYAAVKIFGTFVPTTDNDDLWLRLSNDAGSTFRAGASDYAWMRNYSLAASEGGDGDDADAQFKIHQGIGSAAGEQCSFEITIISPAQSGLKTAFAAVSPSSRTTANTINHYSNSGMLLTAEVNDAVRLMFSTGTIASGHIDVFGYPAP